MNYFYDGRKFSSYEELQHVIRQCKNETDEEFVIRDCKMFKCDKRKRDAAANRALIYNYIKLTCIRGGRKHIPRGQGQRTRVSLKIGCNAHVIIALSDCNQYLEVFGVDLQHNHPIEPRPLTRKEFRAEKRRQRLMERLKISHDEAVLLEKLNYGARNNRKLVGPHSEDETDDFSFDNISSKSFKRKEPEDKSSLSLNQNIFFSDESREYGETSAKEMYSYKSAGKSTEEMNENSDYNSDASLERRIRSYNDKRMKASKRSSHSESFKGQSDEDSSSDEEEYESRSIKKSRKLSETGDSKNFKSEASISDDDDYRRPLIIPANQNKKRNDLAAKPEVTNIFTGKGDDGMCSTFNGIRKYKDDKIFEALGTIEELSSSIGFAKEFLPFVCGAVCSELVTIQCVLQDMVVHVGTPRSTSTEFHRENSQFPEMHITFLENIIKVHESKLPKVEAIILPSGGQGSAALHVARTVCRRAERCVACLVREGEANATVMRYLNRLGDYLFVVARVASMACGMKECIYTQPNYEKKPENNYQVIYVIQPSGPSGYNNVQQPMIQTVQQPMIQTVQQPMIQTVQQPIIQTVQPKEYTDTPGMKRIKPKLF